MTTRTIDTIFYYFDSTFKIKDQILNWPVSFGQEEKI